MKDLIFKFSAMGDTVYVKAQTEAEAMRKFTASMGDVPRSMLAINVVKALPKGEEFLYPDRA